MMVRLVVWRGIAGVVSVVGLLGLVGCSAEVDRSGVASPSSSSAGAADLEESHARPDVEPELLRVPGTSSNYVPYLSVADAVAAADVVVVGEVAGWSDGVSVVAPGIPNGRDRSLSGLMRVRVLETFGAPELPETVYIELDRGFDRVDEAGEQVPDEGGTYNYRTLAELERGAPVGSRVAVLGERTSARSPSGDQVVVNPAPGLAEDAFLISPLPQGLWLEDADGSLVNGRLDDTDAFIGRWPGAQDPSEAVFDVLVAQIEDASAI